MNIFECIKRLFTGGALENTGVHDEAKAQKFWDAYENRLVVDEPSTLIEERDYCDMCRKRRKLASVGEMWYDAPVEKVLGSWVVSDSRIYLCFTCTRDYLFQGQLRRKEFNGFRN